MTERKRDCIMAGELFVEAQPHPSLLPDETFSQLVESGKNTVKGMARALQELAEEGNQQAARELAELSARAEEFDVNRHWLWEPDCGGAYTMVNWQPHLVSGHRNCISWHLAGERFIPVWLEEPRSTKYPQEEPSPSGFQPAQAGQPLSSLSEPRPRSETETVDAAELKAESDAPQAAPTEFPDAPETPAPEAHELKIGLLHCLPRPGSPLPDSLWRSLLPGQENVLNIYLTLARLRDQADPRAKKTMEHIRELESRTPGEPFPAIDIKLRSGGWVVDEDELSCLAMVAAGLETAPVLIRGMAPLPAQPASVEAAAPTPQPPSVETPGLSPVACTEVPPEPGEGPCRSETLGLSPVACTEPCRSETPGLSPVETPAPTPPPPPAALPHPELPANLSTRITHFAHSRSQLPSLAQARQLASLLQETTQAMPDSLVWTTLGGAAGEPPSAKQRLRAAKMYLCNRVGISPRYLNRLISFLSLKPTVQKEAENFTELQLRPILKLPDETIQTAVVWGIVHEQEKRSQLGQSWTYPGRAVQRLVDLILAGTPIKSALKQALEKKSHPERGAIVQKMHGLAAMARAQRGSLEGLSPEEFMAAYKELQLALGELTRDLKKKGG